MNSFEFLKFIKNKYDVSFNIAEKIYEKLLNEKYLDNINKQISSEKLDKIKDFFNKHPNYPYEYILNEIESFGKRFYVDEKVLIPRQETEYLVDLIINNESNKNDLSILDVCTGSGYIAICLEKLKSKHITATDISFDAIKVAKKNIEQNCSNIELIQGSFLKPILELKKKYDIVVSNPPYIEKEDDYSKSILYEPEIALFVKDVLYAYKEILNDLDKVLNKNGRAYFETSSLHHDKFLNLAKEYPQFKFEFLKDNYGLWRYMIVEYIK